MSVAKHIALECQERRGGQICPHLADYQPPEAGIRLGAPIQLLQPCPAFAGSARTRQNDLPVLGILNFSAVPPRYVPMALRRPCRVPRQVFLFVRYRPKMP